MIPMNLATQWLSRHAHGLARQLDTQGPLPPWLAHAQAKVARRVVRLPSTPPSVVAALAIIRQLWPRFPVEMREGLCSRVIESRCH